MITNLKHLLVAVILIAPALPAVAGGEVYVPMGSGDRILVVDSSTDRVIGKITEIPNAHGLAGTPDGEYLVAGSYDEFRPGEHRLPSKPAGMSEAEHQAHHAKPAGRVASAPDAVSFLSIIRIADGTVVRRVEVPGAVHHTAVTPDGRYAIATHPDRGRISIVDLETFELTATVSTGPKPNYAVVSGDGSRVYVSNAGNDTVSEVDTGRWIVRRKFVTGATPEHIVLSSDDASLYVNNVDDGTVSVIDIGRGEATRTYAIGGKLHGIDLSDDGNILFVSGKQANKLAAIDLRAHAVRSIPLAPSPYHLTAVRGTGKLYVSSARAPKMWVVDQESLQVTGEIPLGGKGHQMVVVQR